MTPSFSNYSFESGVCAMLLTFHFIHCNAGLDYLFWKFSRQLLW